MGRRVPDGGNTFPHPLLSSSPLHAASVIATMAIIAALCGVRSRKSSSRHVSASRKHKKTDKFRVETQSHPPQRNMPAATTPTPNTTQPQSTSPPPPPPPSAAQPSGAAVELVGEAKKAPERQRQPRLKQSSSVNWTGRSSTGKRKPMVSLSMKMGRSTSVGRLRGQPEEQRKKHEKWREEEESIWMKRIILGERCRVPNEEEEEAVLYDEKGNRFSTFHPRTPRSLPVSRTSSFIEPTALPQ